MFALWLKEDQGIAPKVGLAVHDGGVVAAAHGGRAGYGIGACGLGDVDLHMDDGLRAIAGRGNPRVLKPRFHRFGRGLWCAGWPAHDGNTHETLVSRSTSTCSPGRRPRG